MSEEQALTRISYKKKRTPTTYEAKSDIQFETSKIVNLRKSLNMSQQEFALAVGVSDRTIGLWEVGKTTPPRTAQHLLHSFALDRNLVFQFVTLKKKSK